MDNSLPDFFYLLDEAQEASKAVDFFDLDSNNVESSKRFHQLEQAQCEAVFCLIEYVKQHGDAVVADLTRVENGDLGCTSS